MDVEKLIEDVARAIHTEAGWRDVPPSAWCDCSEEHRAVMRNAARSAILATLRGVREPSGETVNVVAKSCLGAQRARNDYTAMIDHLIKTVEG